MSQEDAKERRVKNLNKTQATRKEDYNEQAKQAIERLKKAGRKINFPTVAREANVSVSYLYKYDELKLEIADLRRQQSSLPLNSAAKPVSSKSSQVVGKLKYRIQELNNENEELKRKNQALAGQVYRVHQLQAQVERQQEIIKNLEASLKEAQAQVSAFKVTPIDQAKSLQNSPISKVQKSGITDRIQSELNALGIKLNSTLRRKIESAPEAKVLDAIEAMKAQKKSIRNPSGWLSDAIDEEWTPDSPLQQQDRQPEVFRASTQPEENFVPPEQLKQLGCMLEGRDD